MYLFNFKELTYEEIPILSFIKSHIDNNQQFYYTDEQIAEAFQNKIGLKTLRRILKSLNDNNFIIRTTSKKLYGDKSWGNRRVIILGEKLTNNTSTIDDSQNIQSNEVKTIEPITTTTTTVKVQQKEENQVDFQIETNLFHKKKVDIKKFEASDELKKLLMDLD